MRCLGKSSLWLSSNLSKGYSVSVTSANRTLGNRMLLLPFPTKFPVFWVDTLGNKIIYEADEHLVQRASSHRAPRQSWGRREDEVTPCLTWQAWKDGSVYVVAQIKCRFSTQQTHLVERKVSTSVLWKTHLAHLHMLFILWYFIKAVSLDNNIFQSQTQIEKRSCG